MFSRGVSVVLSYEQSGASVICAEHTHLRNTMAWFRDGAGFVTGGEDGYVRVHHFDKDYFTAKKYE